MKTKFNFKKRLKATIIIGCFMITPLSIWGQVSNLTLHNTNLSDHYKQKGIEAYGFRIGWGINNDEIAQGEFIINLKSLYNRKSGETHIGTPGSPNEYGISFFSHTHEILRLTGEAIFYKPLKVNSTSTFKNLMTLSPASGTARFYFRTKNGNTDHAFAIGQHDNGAAFIWNESNNNIHFGTNGEERLKIEADGGIKLKNTTTLVRPSGTARFYFRTKNGDTNHAFTIGQHDNGAAFIWNESNNNIHLGTNNHTRILIEGDGHVKMNNALSVEGNVKMKNTLSVNGKMSIGVNSTQSATLHIKDLTGHGQIARFVTSISNVEHGLDIDAWNGGANIDPIKAGDNIYMGRDAALGNLFIKTGNVAIGTEIAQVAKLYVDGFTYIGSGNPTETLKNNYQFAVNGKIKAQEIDLDYQGWPDYVFESGYERLPIDELKGYIEENGHLPNVKPAEEVEKNGLGVAEANKMLMEKVEELTLYIIELQEQINEIKKNDK